MRVALVMRSALRLWMPASRARRYKAALAVLLSIATFERLDSAQRARLDAEIIEIYKPFGIYPWWRTRRAVPRNWMAAQQAVGMFRLGLPTATPMLSWSEVLHPWHQDNPTQLTADFSPFHKETDRALLFLKSKGVLLPPGEHFGYRWLQEAHSSRPGGLQQ